MSSIIKVDTIQNQSGANIISESSNTITVGASGDTINFGGNVGTISGHNYPAFSVDLSTTQSTTNNVFTKINLDSEVVDTDNAFSSSRFTVPAGADGKYFIIARATGFGDIATNVNILTVVIRKNGSTISTGYQNAGGSAFFDYISATTSIILDLVATDYIELYVNVREGGSTGVSVMGNNFMQGITNLSGYRIGA